MTKLESLQDIKDSDVRLQETLIFKARKTKSAGTCVFPLRTKSAGACVFQCLTTMGEDHVHA